MRWFRRKRLASVNIDTSMAIRQVYKFNQLFRYKPFNPNVLVTNVIVRIGNVQLYPGAELNRGVTIEGIDPFLYMALNKLVQVDFDPTTKIYQIVGVRNG